MTDVAMDAVMSRIAGGASIRSAVEVLRGAEASDEQARRALARHASSVIHPSSCSPEGKRDRARTVLRALAVER